MVPGAYYVGDVAQLSDGNDDCGSPAETPLGATGTGCPRRPLSSPGSWPTGSPKTLIFRSDDDGHTWKEVTQFVGPFDMDAPYSMFEGKDGALLLFAAGSCIPGGKGWPTEDPRWFMVLMRF